MNTLLSFPIIQATKTINTADGSFLGSLGAFLWDPFSLPFMSRAFFVLLAISIVAAVVGVLVNLRGLEFISDGLTHAVFPGMALGFMWGNNEGLFVGALIAAVLAAVILTAITRVAAVKLDAGVAVVFTALFSIGIIVVSRSTEGVGQLEALFFGHLLTVTSSGLFQVIGVCVVAFVALVLTMKEQIFRAFDPTLFTAARYRIFIVDVLLNVVIALIVVAASTTVGNLLVLAFLIVPAAIARLVTVRLWVLFPCALVCCVLASWLGLSTSYVASVNGGFLLPSAATVVCVLVGVYLLVCVFRVIIDRMRLTFPTSRRSPTSRTDNPAPESVLN